MFRALLAATAALVALPAIALGQTQGLEVVAPDEVTLTIDNGDASEASVWVRNLSARAAVPVFEAVVENADGDAVRVRAVVVDDSAEPLEAVPVPAGAVRRYRVTLQSFPRTKLESVSGELVVRGAGPPASVALAAGEKTFADRGVTGALLLPLVPAALLILLAGAIALQGTTKLGSPLPPDLDFKTSYASTVTAAGALLATVIAASVLPEETTTLTKQAFVALNLIFGIGVVVAGLVYSALQRPVWVPVPATPPKKPTVEQRKMQGRVGGFLAACLITVWAVFGELYTVWLLLDELGQKQGFSEVALGILKALVVAAAVTMAVYTWRRIPAIVASERPIPAQQKAKRKVKADETRLVTPEAAPVTSVSLL